MATDEQYESWQQAQVCKNLSNWCDLIIQQWEDGKRILPNDLAGFKKALKDFDNVMGLNQLTGKKC